MPSFFFKILLTVVKERSEQSKIRLQLISNITQFKSSYLFAIQKLLQINNVFFYNLSSMKIFEFSCILCLFQNIENSYKMSLTCWLVNQFILVTESVDSFLHFHSRITFIFKFLVTLNFLTKYFSLRYFWKFLWIERILELHAYLLLLLFLIQPWVNPSEFRTTYHLLLIPHILQERTSLLDCCSDLQNSTVVLWIALLSPESQMYI